MTRLFTLASLVATLAGCGVAPSGETGAALGSCDTGFFYIPLSLEVTTSASDPWGTATGDVVVYGDDPNMIIYGWDSTALQVVWFMNNATYTDVTNFESYPQSRRFCGGGTNNPGGGSGKEPPDPRWLFGQCAPTSLPTPDAFDAYWYGPYGEGNNYPIGNSWCSHYGEGGCVPQSCSALHLGCGYQTNNCGRSVYCGNCPKPPPPPPHCPCGGTYPNHCQYCQ